MPVALVALILFLIEQSPPFLFTATAPILTVLISTEGDALAFRDPEQFREDVMDDELPRKPLFLLSFPDWMPRF